MTKNLTIPSLPTDNFPETVIRALHKICPDDQLHKAALDFDKLKERESHPDGKRDNAGRFYLNQKYACCIGIRTPSREFPFSEQTHGRTALHVAHSHNLLERVNDIRRYRSLMQLYPELRISATTVLSILAAHEARKALIEIQTPSQSGAAARKRKKAPE